MRAILNFIIRLAVAIILLQTLFFKFTGAEESKFIFESVGLEPWGRWLSGLAELIASILLFIPSLIPVGAVIAMSVMFGALASHLFVLGIEVQGDGGTLFYLACLVFVGSAYLVIVYFDRLKSLFYKFVNR